MANWFRLALTLACSAGAALAEERPALAEAKSEFEAPIGVLLAVGDIARCGDEPDRQHDEAVAAIAAREIERAEAADLPVRLILLGDLAYPGGTAKQYEECFDPAWGDFKELSLPVPGNHEYRRKDEPTAFFSYFGEAPATVEGEPLVHSEGHEAGFYDLRFPDPHTGPWLLIGLNTGEERAPADTDWLRDVLEENRGAGDEGARCVLAFAHHFRFSSGLHGHDMDEEDPAAPLNDAKAMKGTFDILDNFEASVLLSGHDHHFEQFAPQDTDGNADPEGLRSFIVGTGGGEPYLQELGFRFEQQAANQEFLDGEHYGLLRIELYEDRYSWAFVRADGTEALPEPHEAECQQP
jgi:acid phosphatase type 7